MNGLMYIFHGRPIYCKLCGLRLITTETPAVFNRLLGYPAKMNIQVRCPDEDWVAGHSNGHDYYSWSKKYHYEEAE